MLDKIKQLMEIKKQADQIKRELDATQIEVNEVRGVKIVVSGAQEFQSLEIDQDLIQADNKKRLEENLLRSMNVAIKKSQNVAAGKMKNTIHDGAGIYEFVEEKITISPVGIIPLDIHEGYFFLSTGSTKSTRIYHYRLSIYEKHDEKYRSIKTFYIDMWQRNMAHTYEHIKSELIRHRSELPNPAVYSIETGLSFPVDETLLPIAKRSLVKYISTQAA